MDNSEIEQKNITIAIFRGYELAPINPKLRTFEIDGHFYLSENLKFHSSWEWLMPVVAKIETIENGRFGFTIDPWSIEIYDYMDCGYSGNEELLIVKVEKDWEPGNDKNENLLRDYYEAVNQFIEWYKTNKK